MGPGAGPGVGPGDMNPQLDIPESIVSIQYQQNTIKNKFRLFLDSGIFDVSLKFILLKKIRNSGAGPGDGNRGSESAIPTYHKVVNKSTQICDFAEFLLHKFCFSSNRSTL